MHNNNKYGIDPPVENSSLVSWLHPFVCNGRKLELIPEDVLFKESWQRLSLAMLSFFALLERFSFEFRKVIGFAFTTLRD